MQKYDYKVFNKDFDIIKGSMEEEDIDSVKQNLKSQGFSIIDVKRSRDVLNIDFLKIKLKDEELSNFCGQLAIMVNSGVNIIGGLEMLEQQAEKKKIKKVISDIGFSVKRGKPLAKAMADTNYFPKLVTNMVDAGEQSGNIDIMLFNMETFYEKEAAIKNKIKSASMYPTVLLFVSMAMLIFFNTFIFGELKDLFTDEKNLPLITKVLLGFMNFFNHNIILIIALVIVFIIGLKYITTIKRVKYIIDKISIKIPILNAIKKNIITSRFTWTMAIFLKSAVPILNIIDNIKLIMDNEYYSEKFDNVKLQMINGNSVSDSIKNENIFEPLVTQMIKVGEESGKLEETMLKLSDIYGKRVDNSISRVMALIEPLFTLFVGIFVGILILAMMLPIMQMTSNMK
ncbi:MAG: type II secretion system F family protein [Clostridium sp.]|uniref:type II secretion system F family protein n=1 Tax=Clostridium sp. TaxID=1506 RepID=UPI0039EBE8AF